MSASSTPTKAAKDKERIIKLLHESILHLCKVSVNGPGEIEVDGIVCITQPNESDIVVKVHESFSNVLPEKDADGRSPMPGEKRRAGSVGGEGSKTPRKDDDRARVSRRLINDTETLDLTRDDNSMPRPHRSKRNKTSAVIDLTSGRDTPAPPQHPPGMPGMPQMHGFQQRFNGPGQYNPRMMPQYRPRAGTMHPMRPRQRFTTRGIAPPPLRHMGPTTNVRGQVVPIGGPIPARGFPNQQAMTRQRMPMPAVPMHQANPNMNPNMNMAGQVNPGQANPASAGPATSANNQTPPMTDSNGRMLIDANAQVYKGLYCKYRGCTFTCSNKYYLETHVLQHFDSAPFGCNEEGCDFKTKNKQNLYQHYKAAHGSNNPQFCFRCIKAFKSPEDLNTHTQSCQVSGMKCDHCGEMIQGLMAMARHLTDVYIAESMRSDSGGGGSSSGQSSTAQSPAHSSASPGHAGIAQSPHMNASSPAQAPPPQSPITAPDMSSPLNIMPDPGAIMSQASVSDQQALPIISSVMSEGNQSPTVRTPTLNLESTLNIQPIVTSSPSLQQFTDQFLNLNPNDGQPITVQVPVQVDPLLQAEAPSLGQELNLQPSMDSITLQLVMPEDTNSINTDNDVTQDRKPPSFS